MRTLTTYNASSIQLVSAAPGGPMGTPTIEMYEALHVRHPTSHLSDDLHVAI
jgi:hypothetical protein